MSISGSAFRFLNRVNPKSPLTYHAFHGQTSSRTRESFIRQRSYASFTRTYVLKVKRNFASQADSITEKSRKLTVITAYMSATAKRQLAAQDLFKWTFRQRLKLRFEVWYYLFVMIRRNFLLAMHVLHEKGHLFRRHGVVFAYKRSMAYTRYILEEHNRSLRADSAGKMIWEETERLLDQFEEMIRKVALGMGAMILAVATMYPEGFRVPLGVG